MDNSANAMERLRNMLNVPPSNRPPDWINPLEKIEQLLTCSICLDRYKNPKLLPCQHTFCMEPCLDGLVDNVHRLVKCPECRAEHALPMGGIKTFQTNYSLMGFLEIHLQATEENAGELEAYIKRYNLERCKSCDEKAEVDTCCHCDKKICSNCKTTHMELLKKDLGRLMNQVKRVANRINDANEALVRNTDNMRLNCDLVKDEVRDYVRRFTKELKKREDALIGEIEAFQSAETRLGNMAKENLELESNSITESCEKVDACLKGDLELPDEEMVKYKQIFANGLEHLRTVNIDTDEICNKKIRFVIGPDPHILPHAIGQFGELQICSPQFSSKMLAVDQVYVPKFTQVSTVSETDRRYPIKKRSWADPSAADNNSWLSANDTGNNYHKNYNQQQSRDESVTSRKAPTIAGEDGYSSRFRRRQLLEEQAWNRLKAETNGGAGSSRISPSRLSDNEAPGSSGYAATNVSAANRSDAHSPHNFSRETAALDINNRHLDLSPQRALAKATTQVAETVNRLRTYSNHETSEPQLTERAISRREVERHEPVSRRDVDRLETVTRREMDRHEPSTRRDVDRLELVPRREVDRSEPLLREVESTRRIHVPSSSPRMELTPNAASSSSGSPPSSSQSPAAKRRIQREEAEDEELNRRIDTIRQDWESKQKLEKEKLNKLAKRISDQTRAKTCELPLGVGHHHGDDDSDNENEIPVPITVYHRPTSTRSERPRSAELETPSIGDWRKHLIPTPTEPQPDVPCLESSGHENLLDDLLPQPRFIRSRTNPDFLIDMANNNTNASTHTVPIADDVAEIAPSRPERHNRFKRKAERRHANTTHVNASPKFTIGDEDSDGDQPVSRLESSVPATTVGGPGSRFYRVFTTPTIDYIGKGQPLAKFGSKGSGEAQFNWPRGVSISPGTGEIVVCDSSNHRLVFFDKHGSFMKVIGGYGCESGEFDSLAGVCVTRYGQIIITDRYNHRIQVFDANGRFLRSFGTHGQTNGRFNSPWGVVADNQGFIYVCDKDNHRIQMFQADGQFVGKFGVNGSKDGQFQNPHFIAINKDGQLLITDSSNHRVQVFDQGGNFLFAFGSEGYHEGEFKYPRGIAVDEQGFVVVADSGNNRIQVFYPDGRFLTTFGSWGSGDGQLKGAEDVVVADDGRVIVTDRENHRIQIF